jgi:ABC-2 type transport system permease protein
MSAPTRARGLWRHFLLTLDLNFRSRQAIVYGYAVPLLFLVAFGSVFRFEVPALSGEMGQLLTITILGGACFGMPTALVGERERGIWRRYRLLPVPTGLLVANVLAARVVVVASGAALQVAAARILYHTPLPGSPFLALAAVVLVTGCFLGLGLLVAALANDVPAVQAMGQCLFLPMIMIGGVGIPLVALPRWAQAVSGFMPGRYAVDVLDRAYRGSGDIGAAGYGAFALIVIGLSAGAAGARLFRWESGSRTARSSWPWVLGGFSAWIAVGLASALSGRLGAPLPPDRGFEGVSDAAIASIRFDALSGDHEFVSPLSSPFPKDRGRGDLRPIEDQLRAWSPGHDGDPGQAVRNLLSLAAVADVSEDLREGDIARLVFDELRGRFDDARLRRILAWIILYPSDGTVVCTAPEFGLAHTIREETVRQRVTLYAKKFLGRLEGALRD